MTLSYYKEIHKFVYQIDCFTKFVDAEFILHSDIYNYLTYRYFLFGVWTMGHPLQIIRVKRKATGNLNFYD